MPATVIRAAALALICCPCLEAAAQEVPRFDVEATCRAAPALTPQDRSPFEGCVRDERAAEGQLRATWGNAGAEARRICAEETRIGGAPSSVDVLTCLEMYQANGSSGTPPRARPRQ